MAEKIKRTHRKSERKAAQIFCVLDAFYTNVSFYELTT
jgi:hypothetical protein